MRIISKFRDYYDAGIAYGIDPKLIYVREEKEIEFTHDDRNLPQCKVLNELVNIAYCMPNYEGNKGVIGFCGKAYPYYTLLVEGFNQACISNYGLNKIKSKIVVS